MMARSSSVLSTTIKNLNENTKAGAWRPSCSRSCSPTRTYATRHDNIDGRDAGIEKHVGGTSLVPSSSLKITKHQRHNHHRCCT